MGNDAPVPVIVPQVHITQLLMRHEAGPQDSDSNYEGSDIDPEEEHDRDDIVSAARRRWIPAPTPPLPPTPAAPLDKNPKKHKTEKHRRARREKREAMRADAPEAKPPKAVVRVRARQTSPLSLPQLHFSQMPLPVASTGWMGLRAPPELPFEPEVREYTLAEARAIPGMQYIDWDGCVAFFFTSALPNAHSSKPTPLVDGDRYIFGLLAGRPRDENWDRDVAGPAADLMEEAAAGMYKHTFYGVCYGKHAKTNKKGGKATPLDAKVPRRGNHRAESFGNSMGGGQETPSGFVHSIINTIVLAGLLATKPFKRIAGFTNSASLFLSPLPRLAYLHQVFSRHSSQTSMPTMRSPWTPSTDGTLL